MICEQTGTADEGESRGSASPRRRPDGTDRLIPALLLVGWVATGLYAWYLAVGAPADATFFDLVVYDLPIFAAAAICAVRAHRSPEVRWIWIAFAAGLFVWGAADVYYVNVLDEVSGLSLSDAGYLLALPLFFAGIGLMARRRIGTFSSAGWLDGAIAALAFACVGAALLAPALIGLTSGDPGVVFINLAYPVGDLILLAFLAGVLTMGGVRGSRALIVVAAGIAIWAGADAGYLYLTATGEYVGGWIDLLWPIGAMLIAQGAARADNLAGGRVRVQQPSVLVPLLAALAAIFVLMLDHFERLSTESILLGGATLIAVATRLLVGSGENRRLVTTLSRDSVTDPLTGLGNRRRLFGDLERVLGGEPGRGHLALFDLDGFKAYNDNFGHSLGDALLRNLGHRLREAARPVGSAYRLGGDEFCVLIESEGDPSASVQMLREAIYETGESFEIGASCGLVRLGEEAGSANEALRIADQRMYADKGSRARRTQHREAHDVLVSVLREHEPALELHVEGVGTLATAVAERMGLEADQVDTITRAAELHDIGKVAIPDTILRKRGPLNEEEWALMREHTLIGERILSAVPSLEPVGTLVRASHERWDGEGYPDGLGAEQIPLGARIIFVCDAFDAMVEERPYHRARTSAEAVEELRRNAGTQFDPEVVDVFCAVFAERPRPERRALVPA